MGYGCDSLDVYLPTGTFGRYNYDTYRYSGRYDNYNRGINFGGGRGLPCDVYNPNLVRAENLALTSQAKNIYDSINSGEADKVTSNFERFKAAYMGTTEFKMLTRGMNVDDQVINAMVADKYNRMTGTDLEQQIDDGVRGNWWAGFWNGLTGGIAQCKSNDDVKNELLGRDVPTSSKVAKTVGAVTGGAVTGAAIGTCICPGAGTLIGGAIGAGVGLISRLWS